MKSATLFVICFLALIASTRGASLPERLPHGCYPVRLTVRTGFNGVQLTLDGTVPGVNYLVLVRTNSLMGGWRQLTQAIGAQKLSSTTVRLRSGSLPVNAVLTAGSGEDADGDMLPDIYEDLVTRTDPLDGNTGGAGDDGYRDTDGDGWINMQEFQNNTLPGPIIQLFPQSLDSEGIRKTIRRVACVPTKDGFALTVEKARLNAHYLLLVKNGDKGFWKASGFFVVSTNGSPLNLLADKHGMLMTASGPYVLPTVKYTPILSQPEFICGSGEDVDGDGLPDIYEVLATKTAPDKSDTGTTGMLDGYKDLAGDGWTALEKYRRRRDPFAPDRPPGPIELTEPTQLELIRAFRQTQQHDFQYAVKVEVRRLNPPSRYQVLQENAAPLFPPMQRDVRAKNVQIRITLAIPEKKAPVRHSGGP